MLQKTPLKSIQEISDLLSNDNNNILQRKLQNNENSTQNLTSQNQSNNSNSTNSTSAPISSDIVQISITDSLSQKIKSNFSLTV